MNIKPILIVRIPFCSIEQRLDTKESIKSSVNDWSVLVVSEDRDNISFEGIMAEKLNSIQFDELKNILNDIHTPNGSNLS